MTMTTIDLFSHATPYRVPLPNATRTALQERGIEVPEFLVLLLRPATAREVEELAGYQVKPPSGPEATRMLRNLLLRRVAPDTDERVVDELVKDLPPTGVTQLMFMYTEGRPPNPKEQAAIQERVRTLLAASPPAAAPSSPSSTGSTKKRSRTARPGTSPTS
jgi:hypothetical protein